MHCARENKHGFFCLTALCMSQIQECPSLHLTFFIFLVKFPTMKALSLVKCPVLKGLLRGQMSGPLKPQDPEWFPEM